MTNTTRTTPAAGTIPAAGTTNTSAAASHHHTFGAQPTRPATLPARALRTAPSHPAAAPRTAADETALVFPAMGTMVSIHSVTGLTPEVEAAIRARFEELEDRFSTYRSGSEATAVLTGRCAPEDASPEFQAVLAEGMLWMPDTAGAFSPLRPDGAVDLTGIVKAIAIREACRLLAGAGLRDWCINVGGDVVTSGARADGRPWVVGIVDPDHRSNLLSQYTPATSGTRAVATSGYSERGEHIWGAEGQDEPDQTFSQVTVVADDIVTADVLATAILAGGGATLRSAQQRHPIEVLAVGRDGTLHASPAFRA